MPSEARSLPSEVHAPSVPVHFVLFRRLMGSPSSPPLRPRRPWYLNVALALAWLMGAGAVVGSSYVISLLHKTPDQISLDIDSAPDLTEAERNRQKEASEAYTTALHHARNRVIPLVVAELLVGAAMVVFAQRAAVGRSWARHALIQLTVAHVGLAGLEWVLTPDMRGPENNLQRAEHNLEASEADLATWKLVRLAGLGLGIGVGAVTILGLTLRGSRAFYGAMAELSEP